METIMIRANISELLRSVKEDLINKILDQYYPPGSNFPSEKTLMEQYNLSRGYIRQILHELQLEGYLTCSQGKRTRVCSPENYSPYIISSDRSTFAIAMQDQQTKHTQRILQGFMEVASQNSIQTISYNLYFDITTEQKFLRNIKRMNIHGLAFWTHFNNVQSCELLQKLVRTQFPIVLIDRYLPQVQTDAIVSDNMSIGMKLTQCLIQGGHHQIAFVTAELDSTSAYERYMGYKKALEEHQLEYNSSFLITASEDELPTYIYKLLAMKTRPSAIVFSYDSLAWKAYQEIIRLGYKVPEEIELATLGDEELVQTYKFPAWFFCQNSLEIGRLACKRLIQRKENPNTPPERVQLKPIPDNPQFFTTEKENANIYTQHHY